MDNTRDIVTHNLAAFVKELVDLTIDGWVVVKGSADMLGHSGFTVSMRRDVDTVEAMRVKALAIEEKPKLTRAEIMANARAAQKRNQKLVVTTIIEQ